MYYKNARIFCSDFRFRTGAFQVENGVFGEILPDTVPDDAIDLGGATVIPGLIEVHSHGNSGADFSDGDYDGLKAMAAYYLRQGITSFAPASMTLPYDVLEKAFATAVRLKAEAPAGCSRIRGIQMEGPYFSYKKRGAQNPDYLKNPDFDGFQKLYDGCGGLISIVDVAPELPGAAEFAEKASKLCTVSVAHTDSDYDHAKAVFDAGATHLTHLYNAMPGINHRNPGVIPAAVENPGQQKPGYGRSRNAAFGLPSNLSGSKRNCYRYRRNGRGKAGCQRRNYAEISCRRFCYRYYLLGNYCRYFREIPVSW